MLYDLTLHATRPEFVYSHEWQVGYLVIWDNRCTMHRGRPHDDAHPCDLRRATTLEAGSTLDEAAEPNLKGRTSHWQGDRRQTTVWAIANNFW